jgi:stearoyl-CoA desaturase (delta-9 desaturase)
LLAVLVSFGLPTLLGWLWDGWIGALGGFLIGGVAKVVVIQHGTFLINSACHTFGRQPYSTLCSARDSFFMALFTFGEGYHNYHHEFQHDYRNGVKAWEWDPTKWLIWSFSKIGLTSGLRRARPESISSSEAKVAENSDERSVASDLPPSRSRGTTAWQASFRACERQLPTKGWHHVDLIR